MLPTCCQHIGRTCPEKVANMLQIFFRVFQLSAMDEEERTIVAISTLLLGYGLKLKKKKRRMWVKQWILRREQLGAFNALVDEFSLSEREDYRWFM